MAAASRSVVRALLLLVVATGPAAAFAQQAQSTLRIRVQDETQGALIHALVTITDPAGVERQVLVNESGEVTFALQPGVYQLEIEAEGFRGYSVSYNVKRGNNTAVATLPVALAEEIIVQEQSAQSLRDKGFIQTLTRDEIDSLSDDPDEMAEQLRQMAGPGAQIFVDGFSGGRLPPKDQIEQIRFHTNSYAAEYHDAGMVRIDVITRPGMGNWRGGFNFGFRDESLNARNAFAPERGPEQLKRFMFNFQGPLAKGKTSLTINADGNLSYDSRTILATTPIGVVNDQIQRPVDAMNVTARIEHVLGGGNTLRAEFSRRDNSQRNLGVGDFDLPERAYATDSVVDTLRARNTRVFGKKLFSELRVEFSRSEAMQSSTSHTPTVRVLDHFTSGGAGLAGTREGRLFTLAQNFDLNVRKHALRFGVEVNGGWWDSNQQSNANGTFTFSSMEDYLANRPQTYVRRVGDPSVTYSQYDAGWYVQDDFRLTKNINLSVGVRQEVQTHMDDKWNIAPRVAFTYALGKGTMRGGYGIFYDWLETNIYEQTVRVDGTHQIDATIIDPSFPDPGETIGTVLPASRIQLGPALSQPTIHQASIGYERSLKNWGQIRGDYMITRATDTLRSINVNAPINGVRPIADAGNITQIESSGRRDSDRITVALNVRVPNRRVMGNVMYQWNNVRNFADSPLSLPSDSNNPDADWGPSATDVRHRLFFMFNTPLLFGVRAGMQAQYASALPYNITTGLDDNGDTVFNDRPAGVGRNSARGADQWTMSLRVNRSFNLGGVLGGGPVFIGAPASNSRQMAAQRGPGGGPGDGGPVIREMVMDGSTQSRYRLDLYAQISNLFNNTNLNQFVGNLLSPYFGSATSAAPPRRIEIGASLSF
jgi:Carboxypeptidase regulatory-like domain